MNLPQELDPRAKRVSTGVKYVGAAAVTIGAAVITAATGAAMAIAATAAIGGVVLINLLPVVARWAALKKQQGLTALAEKFSEETIREDEQEEARRLEVQQQQYQTQSAEFGNVIDELKANMAGGTEEEKLMLQGQIDQLNTILKEAEASIAQKIKDLTELRRVNKLYISVHRAGMAMKRGQDQQRNAEEIQRLETARTAIKTRMREALAGQKLEAMNTSLYSKASIGSVAQIAQLSHSQSTAIPVAIKETQHVPTRR